MHWSRSSSGACHGSPLSLASSPSPPLPSEKPLLSNEISGVTDHHPSRTREATSSPLAESYDRRPMRISPPGPWEGSLRTLDRERRSSRETPHVQFQPSVSPSQAPQGSLLRS